MARLKKLRDPCWCHENCALNGPRADTKVQIVDGVLRPVPWNGREQVSDRTREIEELARDIYIYTSEGTNPPWSFRAAVEFFEERDRWREKDGGK